MFKSGTLEKNNIFIISRGVGEIITFFLNYVIDKWEKFLTENIRWNKCALTWVKSFHNQDCRERIPSFAKKHESHDNFRHTYICLSYDTN